MRDRTKTPFCKVCGNQIIRKLRHSTMCKECEYPAVAIVKMIRRHLNKIVKPKYKDFDVVIDITVSKRERKIEEGILSEKRTKRQT